MVHKGQAYLSAWPVLAWLLSLPQIITKWPIAWLNMSTLLQFVAAQLSDLCNHISMYLQLLLDECLSSSN